MGIRHAARCATNIDGEMTCDCPPGWPRGTNDSIFTHRRARSRVMRDIAREERLSLSRPYPSDPLRRVALVAEEVGEAMRAVLDLTRAGENGEILRAHNRANVYRELTQTVVMAQRAMIAMVEEDR